jgi:hypothetical protein
MVCSISRLPHISLLPGKCEFCTQLSFYRKNSNRRLFPELISTIECPVDTLLFSLSNSFCQELNTSLLIVEKSCARKPQDVLTISGIKMAPFKSDGIVSHVAPSAREVIAAQCVITSKLS